MRSSFAVVAQGIGVQAGIPQAPGDVHALAGPAGGGGHAFLRQDVAEGDAEADPGPGEQAQGVEVGVAVGGAGLRAGDLGQAQHGFGELDDELVVSVRFVGDAEAVRWEAEEVGEFLLREFVEFAVELEDLGQGSAAQDVLCSGGGPVPADAAVGVVPVTGQAWWCSSYQRAMEFL
ncbi:hypothetical protein ACFRAR_36910 [Kitasatospora sp. NPDC056651]|uniref:hypothetical protein n=1 Tax=Kitasatospora sp. NPDC056651 TaxID=3345892 RepID=UPI00368DEF60